ncbi:MAG TPA: TniQ family protein [Actinocrinis sp.]|uniref:TniQ family protein n=1 Tax=Actinocrinis sp. TaxID=1920516 RepID=UPI002DDD415F|nr:TniQ family protein [Actinocrinis sp.]HEV2345632.1 TniQ family protein [Actinocrinis sp.]
MNTPRSLPIRLDPVPGEGLDSWLEALAHRIHTPLALLLPAVGLREGPEQGANRNWTVMLRPQESAALAASCGVGPDRAKAMTLAAYAGRAVVINEPERRVDVRRVWGRSSRSRFCPQCLADSGGRWQLSWRMSWSFACLVHHCLLADFCPECGRPQRTRTLGGKEVPAPGHCANTQPGRRGSAISDSIRCGGALAEAATLCFESAHPVATAQRLVNDMIAEGAASFGVYEAKPQPSLAALADIRTLARHALAYGPNPDKAERLPEDLWAAFRTVEGGAETPDRNVGRLAPPLAVTTAAGVTLALQVLQQPAIQQAGAAMHWLVKATWGESAAIIPTTISQPPRDASLLLQQIQYAALGPFLKPVHQLRYRSRSPQPTNPGRSPEVAKRRARSMPATFWPEWSLRMTPTERHPRLFRLALAGAVMLIGTRLNLAGASEYLGGTTPFRSISWGIQRLNRHPCWPDIYRGLVRLADYLDAEPVPIDYGRRRSLDYTNLLSEDRWHRICWDARTPTGTTSRLNVVRAMMFERLSGLPSEQAPSAAEIPERELTAYTAAMTIRTTPALARGIKDAARDFLREHGIGDEPLDWSPPDLLLAELDLPAPDPASVNIEALHRLVRREQLAAGQIADRLGTTIDTVRRMLEKHPAPLLPGSSSRLSAPTPTRAVIGPAELTRLYVQEKLTLVEIAHRHGVSKPVINRLANEYGIPMRPAGRHDKFEIPSFDWLHEQYVIRKRPLPDLAAEKGVSATTVARWAKNRGVRLRPQGGKGGAVRFGMANHIDQAPELLRPALDSNGAWLRLQRFADAADFPTLKEAARSLGISYPSLLVQIQRLEEDLGQQLHQRAERGCPMVISTFGARVIEAVREAERQGLSPGTAADTPTMQR